MISSLELAANNQHQFVHTAMGPAALQHLTCYRLTYIHVAWHPRLSLCPISYLVKEKKTFDSSSPTYPPGTDQCSHGSSEVGGLHTDIRDSVLVSSSVFVLSLHTFSTLFVMLHTRLLTSDLDFKEILCYPERSYFTNPFMPTSS